MTVRDLCKLIIDDVHIYCYEFGSYVDLYEGRCISIPEDLLDREVALISDSDKICFLDIKII